MTIDFNTIKVHDLVYLDENGESGWYIVTDVRVGHHIEVRVLGEFYPLIFLDKDDLGTIHKVIRATAVPGAIEALEQIAAGEIAVDVESCDEKKNILVLRPERNEFGYEVVRLARAALRAVRGEESA